jgi:hypothetical protein
LLSAAFAVIGYFGKDIYEHLKAKRAARAEAIAQLEDFQNLLEQSTSTYRSQNYLAQRLSSLLHTEYGYETTLGVGYDDLFYRMYDSLDAEQRELFDLIRGMTENSMHNLNAQLLSWSSERSGYSLIGTVSHAVAEFDPQLDTLRMHLNQWFDKYKSVFQHDERRSLVYLGDEKRHGVSFPMRLRGALDALLDETRGRPAD